jgi:hypothetical protein
MKKIILSTLAALSISAVSATAATQFYVDQNGQVFTKAGEGRVALEAPTPVFAKADKLKLSGLFYAGTTLKEYKNSATSNDIGMEIRRGYVQLKAYLLEDPKSYFRVTYDLTRDQDTSDSNGDGKVDNNIDGSLLVRAKYAYLFLNEILPSTGVEIGLAHRPWHDYEEHNAWYFRNISKVLIENSNGANLSNSADYGVMFKTKTKYFDADYGLFNGEGYHAAQNSNGVSFEWRATAHILGVEGKDKQTELTYFDASFFGQYNKKHKNVSGVNQDLIFGGLHTVYNQPEFLVAAQYVLSQDTNSDSTVSTQAGSGYSFNGEYRLGETKEYRVFARYDNWTQKQAAGTAEYAKKTYIAGAAWEMNKNVQWVANTTLTDNEYATGSTNPNSTSYMVTAEIRF